MSAPFNQPPVAPPTIPVAAPKIGLAVGSLVAGLASFCFWIAIITAPLAVILGIVAIKRANFDPRQYGGKAFAIAGIICGVLAVAVGFLLALLFATGMINL